MTGHEWELSLTFASVKRLRDLHGFDLLSINKAEAGAQPLITILETDINKMVEVVIGLLRPAMAKIGDGLSDAEFEERIDADTLAAMHDAFWDELFAFFQSLRRTDQAKAVEKQRSLVTQTIARAATAIDAIDIEKIIGNAFTNKLESSESTPPDSLAAS